MENLNLNLFELLKIRKALRDETLKILEDDNITETNLKYNLDSMKDIITAYNKIEKAIQNYKWG